MHHDQIKLWNPITKLTPLNNYLSNCVITSSYTLSYKTFGLASNPPIIRKIIPTFASDPGPKKD
jgi:hypothetical protein